MNYDASSLPPSLIPDCERGMSGAAQPGEAVRNLVDAGLLGFWPPEEGRGRPRPLRSPTTGRCGGVAGSIKRAGDYAITVALLLVLWPLLLLIAALIRLDSPGPILFRQERLGLGGRRFRVCKFRTMIVNAEEGLKDLEHLNESDGRILFKMRRDPRVTRVGYLLRRSSLDELPQLFNVLRGEMSLVGPRPLPLRDCDRLERIDPFGFGRRHEVLPGLTGLWQVSGRSRLGAEKMIALDCRYIENWSLWLDLKILVRTAGAILSDWSGSY